MGVFLVWTDSTDCARPVPPEETHSTPGKPSPSGGGRTARRARPVPPEETHSTPGTPSPSGGGRIARRASPVPPEGDAQHAGHAQSLRRRRTARRARQVPPEETHSMPGMDRPLFLGTNHLEKELEWSTSACSDASLLQEDACLSRTHRAQQLTRGSAGHSHRFSRAKTRGWINKDLPRRRGQCHIFSCSVFRWDWKVSLSHIGSMTAERVEFTAHCSLRCQPICVAMK
ncbi:uncharacterized protein LOC129006514 [Pongo pygmaeus]|uniref:uncharacterized protein LOC129006514 n=1 Tax=Pongo pygmaeus TaxID=9600 RepID=UPI0023E1DEBF|nr:uncharacterized protein LOC129006514 [Pongo pygmaeus]